MGIFLYTGFWSDVRVQVVAGILLALVLAIFNRKRLGMVGVHFVNWLKPSFVVVPVTGVLSNHWQSGSFNGQACIYVNAQMTVTNTSNRRILLTRATLLDTAAEVTIYLGSGARAATSFAPGMPQTAFAYFVVQPPPKKLNKGDDLVTKVTVYDNLNNKYVMKRYRFASIEGPPKTQSGP